MYRGSFVFCRGNVQGGHEALHDGESHSAALGAAGGKTGPTGFLHIRDAYALILNDDVQYIVLEDPAAQGDDADFLRVGMDDTVGDSFRNRCSDIPQLLQRWVHLGGKTGHGAAGKGLVTGFAGKLQNHVVVKFHDTASRISTSLSNPEARNTRMG